MVANKQDRKDVCVCVCVVRYVVTYVHVFW